MNSSKTPSHHVLLYIVSVFFFVLGGIFLFYPSILKEKIGSKTPTAQNTQVPAGKLPEETALAPITEKDPETYEGWVERAKSLEAKGDLRRALSAYFAASSKNPAETLPPLERSKIFTELKEYDKALEEVQQLLTKDPKNSIYQVRYASIRLHQIEDAKNTELLDDAKARLANITPATAESLYLSCLITVFEGKEEEVKAACEKVANEEKSPYKGIAGEFIEQYNVFQTFRDGNTTYVDTLNAKTLTKAGFYKLAVAKLKNVLERDKEYRDAWVLLGYSYLNLEKFSQASSALESAYALDPTKALTQYLLAVSYDKLAQKEKAINFYTLAMGNQYEKKKEIRERLAVLYQETQKYEKAVEQYVALIDENKPSSPDIYTDPIWIYIELLRMPDKAIELATKAKETFPNNPVSDNLLGWTYYAKGELGNAKDFLTRALSKAPDMDAANYNMARVLEQEGNVTDAKAFYLKAYQVGSGSVIASLSARSYNRLLETPPTTSN